MKSNCSSYSSCLQRVSRAKRLVSDSCCVRRCLTQLAGDRDKLFSVQSVSQSVNASFTWDLTINSCWLCLCWCQGGLCKPRVSERVSGRSWEVRPAARRRPLRHVHWLLLTSSVITAYYSYTVFIASDPPSVCLCSVNTQCTISNRSHEINCDFLSNWLGWHICIHSWRNCTILIWQFRPSVSHTVELYHTYCWNSLTAG